MGPARLHRPVHQAVSARTRVPSASKHGAKRMPRATDEAEPARDGRHDRRARAATATPTAATDRSTSRFQRCPDYGKLAHLDSRRHEAGRARRHRTTTRRKTRATSCCGKATKRRTSRRWTFPSMPASRRSSRLAHRVLGDGAAPARRGADRHPRRRHRPHLPASRERDRAERGRDAASRSRASGSTSST